MQAAEFVVAVDVGHTPSQPGAISARGEREYDFNRRLAGRLRQALHARGFTGAFLVEGQGMPLSLLERTARAHERNADLFVSVHHDSVQPHYLESWTYAGVAQRYSDRFQGYSVFYSAENPQAAASLAFALAVGAQLRQHGFAPSLHHAEPIPGENRTLVDAEKGVYRFDELIVLRSANMPALLLEAGIIVNRREELKLSDPAYRARLAAAVVDALDAVACPNDRP